MLSELERQEIESALEEVPDRRGAVIDALRIVQRRRRWISDDALRDVADHLAMSEAEVESVATFYSLIYRRPVGRHVILICDSVSCWILGYPEMLEHLRRRLGGIGLGETTADDRFTLLPVACLGVCELAPAMMVDEDVHGHLTSERIDRILEQYP